MRLRAADPDAESQDACDAPDAAHCRRGKGAKHGRKRSHGWAIGPGYRDDLEIDFALFRGGKFDPTINASILERPSANVSDSLVQAMDRVANRVAHDLKKKK